MKNYFRSFLLISILLSCVSVNADITTKESSVFIFCKRFSEIRFFRIENIKDQPSVKCIAYYAKEGREKKIGASTSLETCKSYTEKVLEIIREVSWNCAPATGGNVYTISAGPRTPSSEAPATPAAPERMSDLNERKQL